jgi:hypothetical protein
MMLHILSQLLMMWPLVFSWIPPLLLLVPLPLLPPPLLSLWALATPLASVLLLLIFFSPLVAFV